MNMPSAAEIVRDGALVISFGCVMTFFAAVIFGTALLPVAALLFWLAPEAAWSGHVVRWMAIAWAVASVVCGVGVVARPRT
ncbi:MAG TPA: hypothetical protein VGN74_05645 [Brevundimonas sp.]|uniref:hypothetical protein n=1 Tax=Brevundimonas sp. TaxID=1871086 RepID=UPI002E125D1A|nr:hypothetical protein [Brevundimonas sp.]